MKKITFKTEFTSKEDALAKIPDVLKEDKNVFVLTDGNKTMKVRWEGSLTEGIAVPLKGKDEKLISEDMKHMQHLMGYKSEDTLGVVKGTSRIDENATFKSLMSDIKKKRLVEAELLDEGIMDYIKKGVVTASMLLAFAQANAQSPEKIEQVKDAVVQSNIQMSPEELKGLNDATGINWGSESANSLFQYSPDVPEEKAQVRDISKLNVGPYGHIAKVTGQNHTQDGKIKYTVDITDKSYMESDIFNKLKEYNSELKDVIIQFTIKGTPIPTKTINL